MNWPVVKLGEVAKVDRDSVDPSNIQTATDYLGLEHIENGGQILGAKRVLNGDLSSTKFRFDHNHVLYGKLRPYLAKIALPDFHGICSTDILPIRPDHRLDRRYLAYFLRQPSSVKIATARSTGANLPRLNPRTLADFDVPLPPLDEQKRIAAILDQADTLRGLRQRAIDRLNTLGQAIFYEMFGDPVDSNGISLGEVLLSSGNGINVKQDDSGKGVPVTRIETISNGTIDPARVKWTSLDHNNAHKYYLCCGDILFSHINSPEHIGKTAIYEGEPSDLLHGINLLRLRPNRDMVEPHWLLYLLKSKTVREFFRARCKKAVNQASLNQANIRELYFQLPSIDSQKEFTRKISHVDITRAHFQRALAESKELFSALQACAFGGEV